jgi:hypothetical protein
MRFHILSLFGLTFGAWACDKVRIPRADSTPPEITWKVTNTATGKTTDIVGSAGYKVKAGEDVNVVMRGTDPQGIQLIAQKGQFLVECRDPKAPVQTNVSGIYFPLSQTQTAGPDSMVYPALELFRFINPVVGCTTGLPFKINTITLDGEAHNFYGGVATAQLYIAVTP